MFSTLLRLTLSTTVIIIVLVLFAQVIARLMPLAQIIPIVTHDSPTILLVDVNRHIATVRRPAPSVILGAAISPDQQRIAFTMSDTHSIHVYVGSLFDDEYQRLSNDDLGGNDPAWSPDSSQIAFVGLEPDNKRGIYIVTADGKSSLQTIVKAGMYQSPAWSPDGSQLIFASSHFRDLPDLFVVNSNCRLRCDRDLIQVTNLLVVDTIPVWSPNGSQVAFLSDRNGDYEIFELDMHCLQDTKQPCRRQTPGRLRLRRPIVPFLIWWSLDGRELYFRAWDATTTRAGLYAIKSDCYSLPEGCQPRLVYNLANIFQGMRGAMLNP